MSEEELPPKCILCRKQRTEAAYELNESELERLVETFRAFRARHVHETFGAVPLCGRCFERLGFTIESAPPLVSLTRRRKDDSGA